MSNEMHFKYYRTTPEKKAEICALYEPIKVLRDKVMQSVFDRTGAIAFATTSCWGLPERIGGLVFPYDHEMTKNPHLKTKMATHDEKPVCIIEGKSNRKDGAKFNQMIASINRDLEDIPAFKDFVIDHIGVRQTGFGSSSGCGVAMLSTQVGVCGEVIVVCIPYPGDKKIAPPEYLEEITYGVFYDLTNQ